MTGSDSSLSGSDSKRTHRNKRCREQLDASFDLKMDDFREEMKKLIEDFIKSQGLELNKVTSALKELQETTSKIENSLKFLSDQNSEYKNKIDQLENQLQDDKKYIAILENKLEDVQMGSRKSNFEIKNVPKKNNENTEDLVAMVQCLSRTLDVQISKADMKDVYRIKGKEQNQNAPIIVETNSVLLKMEIMKKAKAFNRTTNNGLSAKHLGFKTQEDTRIFVSEQLTAKGSRLHFLARDLKKTKNYLFCWTTHGKVFVRKNVDSPVILIRSPEQIQQLLQEA
ncbi:hypothetical protein O0L34_g6316 [Tuta absoluta]|nr:hypothetical protein O0L34_g6316 [Tuta absoluta]